MYRRSLTLFFRTVASLVAVGFLVIQPGVSPADAAVTTQQASQFVADPGGLLKANPNGGGRLITQIRDLMLSDPCQPSAVSLASCHDILAAIIGLLGTANDAQKSAVGTGLAEAAQALQTTYPLLSNDIQTALAKNGDKLALEAYQTTVGTQAIGAAGGGGLTQSNPVGTASAGISGGTVAASGGTNTVTQAVSPQ